MAYRRRRSVIVRISSGAGAVRPRLEKRTLKRLYPANESEVPQFLFNIVLPFLRENLREF
jgi:hypothetical protein